MGLGGRLELVRLCDEICQLVRREDTDYGHNRESVNVHVASGKHAVAENAVIEAIKRYMVDRRSVTGSDLLRVKDELITAVEQYAKSKGLT
jgi:hypothetical protein